MEEAFPPHVPSLKAQPVQCALWGHGGYRGTMGKGKHVGG